MHMTLWWVLVLPQITVTHFNCDRDCSVVKFRRKRLNQSVRDFTVFYWLLICLMLFYDLLFEWCIILDDLLVSGLVTLLVSWLSYSIDCRSVNKRMHTTVQLLKHNYYVEFFVDMDHCILSPAVFSMFNFSGSDRVCLCFAHVWSTVAVGWSILA